MNLENHFCNFSQTSNLIKLGMSINSDECVCIFIDETNKVYKYRTFNSSEPFLMRSPLRSQALEFFREKYNLYHEIHPTFGLNQTYFARVNRKLIKDKRFIGSVIGEHKLFDSYAECESACIDKLIEIAFIEIALNQK